MKAQHRDSLFISLIPLLILTLTASHGGIVDTSFNPGIVPGSPWVWELVLQPNGKIIVAGTGDIISSGDRWPSRLVRLNSDGSLDATFASTVHPLPYVQIGSQRRLLQPDGKLVLWVNASVTPDSDFSPALVRLNSDGSLDPKFAESLPISSNPTLLLQRPDGRLIVSGLIGYGSASADGQLSYVRDLYELHPNGRLNTGFNVRLLTPPPNRIDPTRWPTGLALQGDGKLLLSGGLSVAGNEQYKWLVRLLPDGLPDASFRPDPGLSCCSKILIQPDGRILLSNGIRLHPDGSVDGSFDPDGINVVSYVSAWLLQSDGKILIAGSNILVRILPSGVEDKSFPRIALSGGISSLVAQPDGKILVAGEFKEIDGVLRPGLACLNAEPQPRFEEVSRDSTGKVMLTLGVQAGLRVVLEASDDLTNWLALRTNTATGLTLEFEDADAANFPRRFYRARVTP